MSRESLAERRSRPCALMLLNVSWFFVSHRLPIALGAIQAGLEYHVAARLFPESDGSLMRARGIRVHDIPFARGGASLFADVRSVRAVALLYRRLRPDLVHLVTLKAIVMGGLLARLLRVPGVLAAVPGLGYAFVARGPLAGLRRLAIKWMLRLALRRDNCLVVFQNPDDLELLVGAGVVERAQALMIRGAGVDMARFRPTAEPPGRVRVLLPSRMLREKGVPMFVAAARLLRAEGVGAEFLLAGEPDPDNPGSLSREELQRWDSEGVASWLGHVEDMGALFASAHLVCLPTYYGEGVPKALIEAAASGRAIVATDVPGCREIVDHGRSGLLVPTHDLPALVAALRCLIGNAELRAAMGSEGRRLAVRSFSVEQVVAETLAVYRRLLADGAEP